MTGDAVAHSTIGRSARKDRKKPKKPHKDFPLFPHATGRWAKKVRGKLEYFGPWEDPQAALESWVEHKDNLLAGRKRKTAAGVKQVSIDHACDHYLDHIEEKVDKGKRSKHWYEDVRGTCTIIKETLGRPWAIEGLDSDDFKQLADRFELTKSGRPASPVTTQGHIHRTRGLFNWLMKAQLIKSVPAYGVVFDAPSQEEIDNHRDDQPTKLYSRRDVRALLRATKGDAVADRRMHAAILLAINTGCQNVDIETLQFKHIDWRKGWYIQPRTKKAKKRRAKLWRRTIKAIDRMVGDRERGPKDLVFVSSSGGEWRGRNCLAKEFKPIRDATGIEAGGFQWLRHTFITNAIQTGDRDAVKIACGHASRDITDNYVHKIFDPRQIAIAKHVEQWLLGKRGAK